MLDIIRDSVVMLASYSGRKICYVRSLRICYVRSVQTLLEGHVIVCPMHTVRIRTGKICNARSVQTMAGGYVMVGSCIWSHQNK